MKLEKQKEREAKKRRIKRQLEWKARKKAAIAALAKIGILNYLSGWNKYFPIARSSIL